MEFTNEQKLIVALLTDIHAALKIKDSVNPEFVQSMVSSGHTWALQWQYPGIFQDSGDTPASVLFVADVLTLWERLEQSFEALTSEERAELEKLSPVFGKSVRFQGFDGNHGDSYSIAKVLVGELGRWTRFADRDLNAHMNLDEAYARMLATANALKKGSFEYELNPPEMAQILNELMHPDNR